METVRLVLHSASNLAATDLAASLTAASSKFCRIWEDPTFSPPLRGNGGTFPVIDKFGNPKAIDVPAQPWAFMVKQPQRALTCAARLGNPSALQFGGQSSNALPWLQAQASERLVALGSPFQEPAGRVFRSFSSNTASRE